MTRNMKLAGKGIGTIACFALACGLMIGATSANAQPFDPAENDTILGGSAGFTDIFALSEAGRAGDPLHEKVVSSIREDGSDPGNLSTVDLDSGTVSTVDALVEADTNGNIFGIVDVAVSGYGDTKGDKTASVELPASGRMRFREKVEKLYVADGGDKALYQPYHGEVVRSLKHQVALKGNSRHGKISLKATNEDVRFDYDDDPLTFVGSMKTSVKGFGKGESAVVITGLIDNAAWFRISAPSITVDPSLQKWQGDAQLTTPFNTGKGTKAVAVVPGGDSKLKLKYYDEVKGKTGRFSLKQSNEFEGAKYKTSMTGFLLNTEDEAQELVDGDMALSDLQYRDRNFSFRTPAASTSIRSTYADESILERLFGGGGGG